MKTSSVETLVLVLLYGGLLVLCLSYFVGRSNGAVGWTLAAGGTVAVAIGVLLIYLRSRMRP